MSVGPRRVVVRGVTVGREHEGKSCTARGIAIVGGISNHDGRLGGDLVPPGGLAQRCRIGLFCREGIAAENEVERQGKTGLLEQASRKALAFVRDAAERHTGGFERRQRLDNARINAAVAKQIPAIAAVECIERAGEQRLIGLPAETGRETAADQRFDPVADPGPGGRETRRRQADRVERLPETMRKIGRRVYERAIEIDGCEPETFQNTRTAISAGAASSFSSSSSRRSRVSEAPAISSEVQYSPT